MASELFTVKRMKDVKRTNGFTTKDTKLAKAQNVLAAAEGPAGRVRADVTTFTAFTVKGL